MAKKKAAAAKEVERKVLSNGVILIKYDDGSYALLTPISAEDSEDVFGGEAEESDDEEDEDEDDSDDDEEDEDEDDSDDDEEDDSEDSDEDEDDSDDEESDDEDEVTPEDLAEMDLSSKSTNKDLKGKNFFNLELPFILPLFFPVLYFSPNIKPLTKYSFNPTETSLANPKLTNGSLIILVKSLTFIPPKTSSGNPFICFFHLSSSGTSAYIAAIAKYKAAYIDILTARLINCFFCSGDRFFSL